MSAAFLAGLAKSERSLLTGLWQQSSVDAL
jgi:hypothetical protein